LRRLAKPAGRKEITTENMSPIDQQFMFSVAILLAAPWRVIEALPLSLSASLRLGVKIPVQWVRRTPRTIFDRFSFRFD
jgi:hypothetical protein